MQETAKRECIFLTHAHVIAKFAGPRRRSRANYLERPSQDRGLRQDHQCQQGIGDKVSTQTLP